MKQNALMALLLLTLTTHALAPAQMTHDIVFTPAADPKDYREPVVRWW